MCNLSLGLARDSGSFFVHLEKDKVVYWEIIDVSNPNSNVNPADVDMGGLSEDDY